MSAYWDGLWTGIAIALALNVLVNFGMWLWFRRKLSWRVARCGECDAQANEIRAQTMGSE